MQNMTSMTCTRMMAQCRSLQVMAYPARTIMVQTNRVMTHSSETFLENSINIILNVSVVTCKRSDYCK